MSLLGRFVTFLLFVVMVSNASAYCIQGNSSCSQTGIGWPGASATFYSKGFRGSSSTFDNAFVEAMQAWNDLSNFKYSSVASSIDPCAATSASNGTRSWEFNSSYCGVSFGSSTLAVALIYADSFTPTVRNIRDADIVFNTAFPWRVYAGSSASAIDFRRVAVHELGHALGLDHELNNVAIMAPVISHIETPQADDIAGMKALYGNLASSKSYIAPVLLPLLLD